MGRSNGGFRLILNLKKLNEKVDHKKFKIEAITTLRRLITAFLSWNHTKKT